MIKLNVYEFCQNCMEFEPRVTQRLEQLDSNYGESFVYGDTILECEHRQHCEAIYNYLKKENNDGRY